MELLRIDTKCCLTCQSYVTERTVSFDESGRRAVICDPDEGICTDGDRYNKKRKPAECCRRYRRWNTLDVILRKEKMQRGILKENRNFESGTTYVPRAERNPVQSALETKDPKENPAGTESFPDLKSGLLEAFRNLTGGETPAKENSSQPRINGRTQPEKGKSSLNTGLIVFIFVFFLLFFFLGIILPAILG